MSRRIQQRAWPLALAAVVAGKTGCSGDGCGSSAPGPESLPEVVAACEQAELSARMSGAEVDYRVLEPVREGCKLTMTFTSSPNPDWTGKHLTFVVDRDGVSEKAIKDAVEKCLLGERGEARCEGPLAGAMGESANSNPTAGQEPSKALADGPCGRDPDVDTEPLYPMPKEGKWGYVNADGEWVLEPQWTRAMDFSEGRAVVQASPVRHTGEFVRDFGEWGVIDEEGEYVVQPTVSSPSVAGSGDTAGGIPPFGPFSEGCAVGKVESHHWITRDGRRVQSERILEQVADGELRKLGPFSQGRAWFKVAYPDEESIGSELKVGWVERTGDVVIEPTYYAGGQFGEGLAPARAEAGGNWFYVDEQGERALTELPLDEAGAFTEGWAPVEGDPFDADFEAGFVDAEGELMDVSALGASGEAPELDEVGSFRDGLAPVYLREDAGAALSGLVYIRPDGTPAFAAEEKVGAEICNTFVLPEFRHGLVRLIVAKDEDGECGKDAYRHEFAEYDTGRYVYLDTAGEVVLQEGKL